MTAVSLVFLVVCVFGAFAYGSATMMALRQVTPVWAARSADRPPPRLDRVNVAMFALCTVWFALNAVGKLQQLAGTSDGRSSGIDFATFVIAFAFPPLIMHVVYRETGIDCPAPRGATWGWLVAAMYVVSPAVCLFLIGTFVGWFERPIFLQQLTGLSLAALFTVASAYSMVVMFRRRSAAHSRSRALHRSSNGILFLFFLLATAFLAVAILGDREQMAAIFELLTRVAPLAFLIVAMYVENRFGFYDLIIKRAAMLIVTVLLLGATVLLVAPLLESMPAGPVRPWLMAIALAPTAMALPWLSRQLSALLDRLWFARQLSGVEAARHLLGALQAATDERSLVEEAGRRLSDVFNTPMEAGVDEPPADPARGGVEVEAATPSGPRVRLRAVHTSGGRRLLSEDMEMLQSLATVFGFMVATVRLQVKRQEQELVAQDLRLQTSRSELKALRAQINPHFLFNALNAIASLIHTDPGRADEAVEQLAEVFRYTLRRSDSEWAPLDQELALARAYLDVEQARFGARLSCLIDSDHLLPPPLVPSMLLQTLIENAVKHGVSQTRGAGRIEVIVRTTASEVAIEVRDNGPGPGAPPTMPRDGTGFGLRSVRERLAGHFGDRAALSLTRDATGTTTIARIVMPVVRVAA
jgi:two-component system LytT family sensor kinase